MTYTFRWRTGPLTDIIEGEYTTNSPCLTFAVTEFKHFIRANRTSEPFIVSYFYLAKSSDKTYLGEFTSSFYFEHFKEFQNV